MEKKWKHSKSSMIRGVLLTVCAVFFFLNGQFTSQAAGTGKIKVGSAIIRQSADKSSEPVATSSQGTVVTINNEVTDAAGSIWYEIQVDANTIGYVRSDLVEREGGSDAAQMTNDAGTASGAEVGPETPMDPQYATIKVRAAKIRTGASTNKGTVESLPDGSQVIISGQTIGSDKPWYYVTFTGADGTEKSGYVRSDLVTLGDMVPVQAPEEQPTEEEQPEYVEEPQPEVQEDYELIYQPNSEGEYEWYLRDRTGEKAFDRKLSEILDMINALDVNQSIDSKTISKQRIIIIALIGVIVLLAVVITILVFKLRDASYEDDDDEEDDEDEEDEEEEENDRRKGREEPVRRRREEREEPSAARRRTSDGKQAGARRSDARRSEDTGRIPEGRRSQGSGRTADARRSSEARRASDGRRQAPEREVRYEEDVDVPIKTGTKRRAKNFMMDDDEFEFEFLNRKDKDV